MFVIGSYAVIGLIMFFLVLLLTTTSYLNNSEESPQIYFYDEYPNGVEILSSELIKENDEYFLIYQFQVNTEENLKYIFTDIELVNNEGIIVFSKTVDTSGSFKVNKRYSEKKYLGHLELEEDVIVNQTVNQIWVE